jgi:hypothetical protein
MTAVDWRRERRTNVVKDATKKQIRMNYKFEIENKI